MDKCIVTKKPYRNNKSLIMFLPRAWGFKRGDIVFMKVSRQGSDEVYMDTRKVMSCGGNAAVTLRKDWGFTTDDMVELEVRFA